MKTLGSFFQGQMSKEFRQKDTVWSEAFDFLMLVKNWPLIVGDALASKTSPLSFKGDCLHVATINGMFAEHLHFASEMIKKKIIAEHPMLQGKLKNIRYQIRPSSFQEQKKFNDKITDHIKEQKVSLHPWSPEYKQLKNEAEIFFQFIEDQELKQDLVSLYIQSKYF